MSPIFTFIVITLGVLAIFDIIVGVSNDAVNFLNSAIGSKIAPRKIILSVAAVGILVGTLTSSGMMEVAKSGVFYPNQFTFSEIMVLFLGMIVGDIILLDIFNNLGLPTSTTVSMVFGLLGAAVGVAIYRIANESGLSLANLGEFINTAKALAIISAILLSVVLSFLFGLIFMYISRLIFSFRYHPVFNKFGSLWCGISFTGIIYFAIFKGLKSSGLIPVEVTEYILENTAISLAMIWAGASFILWILQMFGANILRITILTGTFSLALAFAGNDLVNFIGVPLAGYESYNLAEAARLAGDANYLNMTMEALLPSAGGSPQRANFYMLAGAGIIMVLTLFFSKKAMNVTETELSLANQNESSNEKFNSSALSRALVQMAISINDAYRFVTPKVVQEAVSKRFDPLPAEERTNQVYDLIRATVNLTAASILISIATSYKLPLSTTYVVFMVAMGSSLADRAWGRESAVYRITGVVTVVMGWFLTAICGFTVAFIISSVLIWGGSIAVVCVVALCLFIGIKSNFFGDKKSAEEKKKHAAEIISTGTQEEILYSCTQEILDVTNKLIRIYNRTLVALFKENRKVLREMVLEAEALYAESSERKHNMFDVLNKMEHNNINTGHFYVQVVDYINEVAKTLVYITRPSFDHINNHHQGLSAEQIDDLMSVNNDVEKIYKKINEMLTSKDFSQLDQVMEMRDNLFDKIADAIKKQLRRIKATPEATSTRANMLYLNLLGETKIFVLQGRNVIKAQKYFIANKENE
ncbi:MAG: inorganic phosphate transporter [Rikenellaceae bacterium]